MYTPKSLMKSLSITAAATLSFAALCFMPVQATAAYADEVAEEDVQVFEAPAATKWYEDAEKANAEMLAAKAADSLRNDEGDPTFVGAATKVMLMKLAPTSNSSVMTNEQKQAVVDAICEMASAGQWSVDLRSINIVQPSNMNPNDWYTALGVEINDILAELSNGPHPEAWYLGGCNYSTSRVRVNGRWVYQLTSMSFDNGTSPWTKSEVASMMTQLNAALDEACSWLDMSMTDEQKVKAAHDWIVRNVTYNYPCAYGAGVYANSSNSEYWVPHTAYGCLVNRCPVCDGYSYAMILILRRFDVEADLMVRMPQSGESAGHAWNTVKVDGQWYHVDVTWDDNNTEGYVGVADFETRPRYDYFLKSTSWWTDTSTGFYNSMHTPWLDTGNTMTDTRYDAIRNGNFPTDVSDNFDVYQAPWAQNKTTMIDFTSPVSVKRGGKVEITYDEINPDAHQMLDAVWASTNANIATVVEENGKLYVKGGTSEGSCYLRVQIGPGNGDDTMVDTLTAYLQVNVSGTEPVHALFHVEDGDDVDIETAAGRRITIPAAPANPVGKHFVSWNTAADGSGTTYAPGASYTIPRSAGWGDTYEFWAIYEDNVYTVTFLDADDTPLGTESVVHGHSAADHVAPIWIGYTFGGWNPDVSNVTSDMTTHAVRTPITYSVSYSGGGYNVTVPAKSTQTYDVAFNLPEGYADGTVTGRSFAGWQLPDGTVVEGGASVINLGQVQGETVTVTATWEAARYTVTFDANGGTVSPETKEVVYGSTYGELPTPVRAGYTFNNWRYNGRSVSSTSTVRATSNHTLTAQWTANTNTHYEIHHMTQNATLDGYELARSDDKQGTTGASAQVTQATFTGFHMVSSGSGTIAGDGSTVIEILYDRNTIDVTYNAGTGATGSIPSETLHYGVNTTLSDGSGFSRTGYTFNGWRASNGTRYTAGQDLSSSMANRSSSTLTLTAQWTATPFTVTFHPNGALGSTTTQTITYGSGTRLTACPYTRPGYDFAGWAIDETGPVVYIDRADISSSVTDGHAIDLYAVWTPRPYTVTFNGNGADGGTMSPQTILHGSSDNLKPNAYAKTGHHFTGWKDPSGTIWADEAETTNLVAMNVDAITLTAQWEKDTFTVTFYDYDGRTVIGTPQQVPYQEAATPPSPNTRTGYLFDGWYGNYTSVTENTDIIEKYKPVTYTISFDGGSGATGSMSPVTCTYDEAKVLPACSLSKTGYDFAAWKAPDNTLIADGAEIINLADTQDANVTLTAQWTIQSFSVRFFDGDTQIGSTQTVEWHAAATAPTPPEHENMVFVGWDADFDSVEGDLDIHAVYRPAAFTITYISGHPGIANPADQTVTFGTDAVWATPSNAIGYDFAGWIEEGKDTSYAAGSAIAFDREDGAVVNVTGKWTPKTYTVTFDAAGGHCDTTSKQVTYKQPYGELPTPEMTGRDFLGWFADSEATAPVEPEDLYMSTADTTLTARWAARIHRVEVVAGGHISSVTGNGEYSYGSRVRISASAETGYHFTDWSVTPANINIRDNSFIMPDADVLVVANAAANAYSIVFDPNGGEGNMRAQAMEYGTSATLTANAFTKTGYDFAGWKDGSDNSYADQQEVSNLTSTDGATITLVAQWKPRNDTAYVVSHYTENTSCSGYDLDHTENLQGTTDTSFTPTPATVSGFHLNMSAGDAGRVIPIAADGTSSASLYYDRNRANVSFDGGGGAGSMEDIGLVYGVTDTLPACAFTKSGYHFAGWRDGDAVYADEADLTSILIATDGADITLVATWEPDTFTVSFDSGGGVGSMEDQVFTYGVSQPLTANAFTRTGYTFAGWQCGDDIVADQSDGSTLSLDTQITLTATWNPITYTVAFEGGDGASGSMDPVQMTYDVPQALPENAFTKEGHDFVGWKCGADTYADTQEVSNLASVQDATVELSATWTPKKYSVRFFDGDTQVDSTQSVEWHGSATAPAAPAHEHMTFTGWVPEFDDITEDTDVYASYRSDKFTIIYHSGMEGVADPATQEVTFGTESRYAEPAAAAGYDFAGWTEEGTSTPYMPGEVIAFDRADGDVVELTGDWTPKTYTLTFDANGGECDTEYKTVTYQGAYGRLPQPTWTGHAFEGWFDAADGGNLVDASTVHNVADDAVVYAHWTLNKHTVTVTAGEHVVSVEGSGTYDFGSTVSLAASVEEGYHFDKWQATPAAIEITDNKFAMPDADVSVKALAAANTYTITFEANGGTGSMELQQMVFGTAANLVANAYAKTGYDFAGWKDDTGAAYEDTQEVVSLTSENGGTVTFTAQWTPKTDTAYVVSHMTQNTTCDGYDLDHTDNLSGTTATAFTPQPAEITGFHLDTASGDANKRIEIAPDGTAAATLYYDRDAADVTFDANGGEGTMEPAHLIWGVSTKLPANAFTKTGHTFAGWSRTRALIADQADMADAVAGHDGVQIELKASWTPNAFGVSFDANGGAGSMDPIEVVYGQEQNLPANAFTRTGYTFAGWATASDGAATVSDGSDASALSTGDDVVLYATWNPIHYTIRFVAGEGAGSAMADANVAYNEKYALPECSYTKEGHDFAGWQYGDDVFAAGAEVEKLANTEGAIIEMTATYAPKHFAVRFFDGTTQIGDTQSVAWHGSATAPASPSHDHMTFEGWDKAFDDITEDTDVYAAYHLDAYTIKYISNMEGVDNPADQLIAFGIDAAYPEPAEAAGYDFAGWTEEGDTAAHMPGELVAFAHEDGDVVEMLGNWTPKSYTLTFDANGGSCDTPSKTVVYKAAYGTLPQPVWAGHGFAGWYDAENGGEKVDAATVLDAPENRTVYARWTLNENIVEVAAGEHVASVTGSGTYDFGAEVVVSATADEGYHISGWRVISGDVSVVDNKFTMPDGGVEIKAVAEPNAYTVVFASGGAAGTMDDLAMVYDQTANLPECAFTRAGYRFNGWTDDAGNTLADGSEIINLASADGATVTLTATWVAKDDTAYTVEHMKQKADLSGYEVADTDPGTGTTDTTFTPQPKEYAGFHLTAAGDANKQIQIKGDGSAKATLYYDRDTLDVTYNAGEGTGSMSPSHLVYGTDDAALAECAFTKAGHAFAGWTSEAGAFADKADMSGYIDAHDGETLVLTATWVKNQFRVSFDNNGGQGAMETIDVVYGEAQALPANTFTKTGYAFAGWATSADGTASIADGSDASVLSEGPDVTLFACWEPITYKIAFAAGEGSGSMDKAEMTYDQPSNLPANAFVYAGHTFTGWVDETGNTYADKQEVLNLADTQNAEVKLTATWTIKTFTVRFFDGETQLGEDQTVEWHAAATAPEPPVRVGYTFVAWDRAFDEVDSDINVHAVYRANRFTVKYNVALDGVDEIADVAAEYGSWPVAADPGTVEGYDFTGWTSDKGAFQPGDSIEIEFDDGDVITLTGTWRAKTYHLYFDPAGGACDTTSKEIVFGQAYGNLPEVNWTGHTFTGWFDEAGAQATKDTILNRAGDVNLTAKWDTNTHEVTVQTGEHVASASGDGSYLFEAQVTLSAEAQDGYHISGWQVVSGGVDIENGKFTMPDNDVVVKALAEPNTYTVSFDANGAEGSMDDVEMTYGVSAKLPACSFEKQGYHFEKWLDETGNEYADEATIENITEEDGATVTLTAQWKPNTDTTYTVKHMKQNAACDGYDEAKVEPLTGTTGALATATAESWNGFHIVENDDYINGKEIEADGTTELILKYDRNTLDVSYNAGEGQGTMEPSHLVYGADNTLAECTFTKSGHAFVKWIAEDNSVFSDKADMSAVLASGDISSIELTATWSANSFTVAFDANGGEGTMASQQYTFGVSQALRSNAFTKTGYTFAGWSLGDGQLAYADGDDACTATEEANATVTLHAIWTPATYSVVFDANGGEGTMSPQELTYGSPSALKSCAYTMVGHDFTGWLDDNGNAYADHDTVENLANTQGATVTLHAQWAKKVYTVKFETAPGTFVEQQVEHGDAAIAPEVAPRAGFAFGGWDKAFDNVTSNMEIHAIWNAGRYTVYLHANAEGIGDLDQITGVCGEQITIGSYPADARQGWTFTKWNTQADGSGADVAAGANDPLAENDGDVVDLYAQWSKNTYTVTFTGFDGSVIATQQVEHGDDAVSPAAPDITGFKFVRWDKDLGPVTAPITIGAVYESISYTVVLHDGNASNNVERTYGDGSALPTPNKEGYTFAGWTENADGTGTRYNGGDTPDLSTADGATVSLYAQYQINTYTVTFTDRDGSTVSTQQVEYASSATAPAAPAVTGYTFVKWDGDYSSVKADMTVPAIYQPNRYTVVYDSNCPDDLEPIRSQEMTYDAEGAIKSGWADGTREGYAFESWNTSANGTGTKVDPGYDGHLASENGVAVTLYAQWVRLARHAMTYEGIDLAAIGLSDEDLPDVVYGSSVVLPALSAGVDGQPFLGWSTDGGQTVVAPGEPIDLGDGNEDVDVVAVWGAVPYKIIAGDGSVWVLESTGSVLIASNAPFEKFDSVNMDGEQVDETGYTARSGSTEIIFKDAYLNTLEVGEHAVEIVSTDGSATGTLIVKAAEKENEGNGEEASGNSNEQANPEQGEQAAQPAQNATEAYTPAPDWANQNAVSAQPAKNANATMSGTGDEMPILIVIGIVIVAACGVAVGIWTRHKR